jgi:hypothetical protein
MENLHPVAQVVAIIVIGVIACVYLLGITGYFDKE